jgi:hypothetical protein
MIISHLLPEGGQGLRQVGGEVVIRELIGLLCQPPLFFRGPCQKKTSILA